MCLRPTIDDDQRAAASGLAGIRNRTRAIEALYRESAPKVFRFLLSLTRSPSDAEDLLHETYLRLCTRDDVETIKYPSSFVMTIAYNLAIDHARRRKSSPIDPGTDVTKVDHLLSVCSAEVELIVKQECGIMADAINRLSPRRREVFTLRRLEELPFKEIAARLGISVSTAEKHMASAVAACMGHRVAVHGEYA